MSGGRCIEDGGKCDGRREIGDRHYRWPQGTQKTRSDGTSIAYSYDLAGCLTLVAEGGNTRGAYYYDAAGRRTHLVFGNTSYTNYLYDPTGALTLVGNCKSDATSLSSFTYYLDAAGMRTRMDIGGSAYTAASVGYSYDSAYELTKEARTGGNAFTNTYWYDNSGNRTKMLQGSTTTTYDYDYIDRMTRAGGTYYQWDVWGNLTQSGVAYNYYWDDANRLTKFDGAGTLNDATYNYAPGSWKRVKANKNGPVTYFAWDRSDLEAEYDGSGNLTRGYVTPGLDDHLSMLEGGSAYYCLQDGLGSVRNVADAAQTVQDAYDYDAWGNDIGSTSPVNNPMQYTGAYKDSYSGPLYYLRHRYYMPGVGIFASRDAMWADVARGWGYVGNLPTALVDPRGLKEKTPEEEEWEDWEDEMHGDTPAPRFGSGPAHLDRDEAARAEMDLEEAVRKAEYGSKPSTSATSPAAEPAAAPTEGGPAKAEPAGTPTETPTKEVPATQKPEAQPAAKPTAPAPKNPCSDNGAPKPSPEGGGGTPAGGTPASGNTPTAPESTPSANPTGTGGPAGQPQNLGEQLAMEQAAADPASGFWIKDIIMNDTVNNWLEADGWLKMQWEAYYGGAYINIHYLYNIFTEEAVDFKVKR